MLRRRNIDNLKEVIDGFRLVREFQVQEEQLDKRASVFKSLSIDDSLLTIFRLELVGEASLGSLSPEDFRDLRNNMSGELGEHHVGSCVNQSWLVNVDLILSTESEQRKLTKFQRGKEW